MSTTTIVSVCFEAVFEAIPVFTGKKTRIKQDTLGKQKRKKFEKH